MALRVRDIPLSRFSHRTARRQLFCIVELLTETDKVPQPDCYLLELPPELRNCIYELALPSNLFIAKKSWDHNLRVKDPNYKVPGTFYTKDFPHIEPALLHACSQIRQEALPIYHSRQNFEIDYTKTLDWATKADILIKGSLGNNFSFVRHLEMFVELRGSGVNFIVEGNEFHAKGCVWWSSTEKRLKLRLTNNPNRTPVGSPRDLFFKLLEVVRSNMGDREIVPRKVGPVLEVREPFESTGIEEMEE